MKLEKALWPFIAVICVILAFVAGTRFASDEGEVSVDALDVISESYFREVDTDDLENASVRGMVQQLREEHGDRFSHYFGPEAFAQFKRASEGTFAGVGLGVNQVKRGLRVATVYDGSPAEEAGIEEGDIVTDVGSKSIAGQDAGLATAKIKGEPGTEVTITVLRPSTGKSKEYTLTRAEVNLPAIESKLKEVNGEQVGYVRLITFNKHGLHAELRDKVEMLDERGAKGLVIDLRANGGGLLDEAVLTSSVFVEDGVIVSTKGRTQPDQTFEAQGDAVAPRPIVVLIDKGSASASEIFTAALQEAGLAKIVGETSFGKGVFQEVIELDNGGALDLTVGEYLTRDGTSLAGKGIEPEIPAADVPATKVDEGLQQALDALGAEL